MVELFGYKKEQGAREAHQKLREAYETLGLNEPSFVSDYLGDINGAVTLEDLFKETANTPHLVNRECLVSDLVEAGIERFIVQELKNV